MHMRRNIRSVQSVRCITLTIRWHVAVGCHCCRAAVAIDGGRNGRQNGTRRHGWTVRATTGRYRAIEHRMGRWRSYCRRSGRRRMWYIVQSSSHFRPFFVHSSANLRLRLAEMQLISSVRMQFHEWSFDRLNANIPACCCGGTTGTDDRCRCGCNGYGDIDVIAASVLLISLVDRKIFASHFHAIVIWWTRFH